MENNGNNNTNNNQENIHQEHPAPPETPAALHSHSAPRGNILEAEASTRGRRMTRSTSARTYQTGSVSPAAQRQQISSPTSSYASASSFIHPTKRITVNELRKLLADLGIHAPRSLNKPELLKLYSNATSDSHPSHTSPTRGNNRQSSDRPTPYPTQGKRKEKSKHAPRRTPARPRPQEPQAQHMTSHLTDQDYNQTNYNPQSVPPQPYSTSLSWPPAPISSSSNSPNFPSTSATHFLPSNTVPPAISQPQSFPPSLQPPASCSIPFQPATHPSCFPSSSLPPILTNTNPTQQIPTPAPVSASRPPFTLSSATPLPPPNNALAMEPPQVSNAARNQILSEISRIGSRSGPPSDTCPSLFRNDLAIDHPLHNLRHISVSLILQGIAPRTLQSYLTAWNSFKHFHSVYKAPFPDFSLLSITSFISHLHISKNMQSGSIRSYLSGIQFFHKLIHGSPSDAILNSQTSLLIKGIQKTHPHPPDPRLPITLNILTKCIHTLRKGYQSINTARTLDTMFTLAFFGFLRCSEITTTSKFNPSIHPTISDLTVLDKETISFFVKQSKTDQIRKGHHIYIFDIPSPIHHFQTLLAFLQFRKLQDPNPRSPLFTDDYNRPVTRFWFQKHLKEILRLSGLSPDSFSSHSFRIGAATTAAHNGLSQSQIQALGRWSSDAFNSYIRFSRPHLKEAQSSLTRRLSPS
ncbi:uncharacterized protein [Danio rerio]|uniref:Uncharacterized protein n=1 Tax=Danio rerio TaxID=7955 RepID=A0AC58GFN1_DANRE